MKNLTTVCFLVAALLFPATTYAAPPVFNGSVKVPTGGNIDSTANPIGPLSGGIGAFEPLSIPSNATIVFVGDSITYGVGATSCVRSGQNPTGTCYADVMTKHYGATEVNKGLAGSCVETTNTTNSTCNTVASLISRYQTDVIPYAGNNSNYFVFLYGTNDAGHGDPAVTVSTFEANYNTVIQAVINAGTSPSHIIIGAIPYSGYTTAPDAQGFGSPQPLLAELNAAVARVAMKNGTLYARTYEALAQCANNWLSTASTGSCMYDTYHPNDTGHSALASAFYVADYQSAIASEAAFDTAVALINNPKTYNIMSTAFGATNRLGVGSTYPQSAGMIGIADPANTHTGTLYFGQESVDGYLQYYSGNFYFVGGPVNIGQSGSGQPLYAWGNAYATVLDQTSTCKTACKVTLASGTATWTFATAYSAAPVCTATPEGVPPSTTVSIAESVSTTAVTVSAYTSSAAVNTADTRVVDVHCIGYPN